MCIRDRPPPPPFEGDIANNAFIEGKSGKVYFYYFPEKQKLCGFMTENGKYKLELYKTDLDSLKAKDLRLIEAKDIIEITNKITLTSKPSYISIGIENDSTSNPILTKIATRLYKFSNKSTWKVRKDVYKRQVYTRRMEGVSIWAVESKFVHASNPDEAGEFFEPAEDKVYRHPTFYDIPEAIGHM